jgi:hypothetical protein
MYVERFVEQERAGIWDAESICLATRPHWFRVIERGAGGLLLMVGGIAFLLIGQPLRHLLTGWAAHIPGPAGTTGAADASVASGPAGVAGTFGHALDVQQILEMSIVWGGPALTIVGALLLGWALLSRHCTEYAITVSLGSSGRSGRIIKVQGVLSRQTVAVPLGMVNNLELHEPVLGRLLGWGDIGIETGNDYDGDRLEHMPDPRGFYQMWKSLLDLGHGRGWSASGTGSYAEFGVETVGDARIGPWGSRSIDASSDMPGRRRLRRR